MEKIIISNSHYQLFFNYKEKAINFLEKKIRKAYLFTFLSLLLLLIVVRFIFVLYVPSFIILAFILFSLLFFNYIIERNKLKIKDSLKPRLGKYEINFIKYSYILWRVKKGDLQALFAEEVKKEIERMRLLLKDYEEMGIGESFKTDDQKKMKEELEGFLIALKK